MKACPYAGGEFNHSDPLSPTFNHFPYQGSIPICSVFNPSPNPRKPCRSRLQFASPRRLFNATSADAYP